MRMQSWIPRRRLALAAAIDPSSSTWPGNWRLAALLPPASAAVRCYITPYHTTPLLPLDYHVKVQREACTEYMAGSGSMHGMLLYMARHTKRKMELPGIFHRPAGLLSGFPSDNGSLAR
jgi:hypothetical protein